MSKALGVRERPVAVRRLAPRLPGEGSQCRRLLLHRSLAPHGEPRPFRRRQESARTAHPAPSPVADRERLALPCRVARYIQKPRATLRDITRRRPSCSCSMSLLWVAAELLEGCPRSLHATSATRDPASVADWDRLGPAVFPHPWLRLHVAIRTMPSTRWERSVVDSEG